MDAARTHPRLNINVPRRGPDWPWEEIIGSSAALVSAGVTPDIARSRMRHLSTMSDEKLKTGKTTGLGGEEQRKTVRSYIGRVTATKKKDPQEETGQ
mgnify:FL=1